MTKIAFIGFGEAAQSMAKDLAKQSQIEEIVVYDVRFSDKQASADLLAKAESMNVVPIMDLSALSDVDFVLSLVVGSATQAVAKSVSAYLSDTAIFIDLNSVGPATKTLAAVEIRKGKGTFVEGAVMARVPPYGAKVPIFVAGSAAEETAEKLNALGMNLEAVGTEPGQASALKMIRSVMVKGVEALLIEALSAAEKAGVTEKILDSVGETFPGVNWRETSDYYLSRTFEHGARRVTEMNEAANTIEELGFSPHMSRAACKVIGKAHEELKKENLSSNDGYKKFVPSLSRLLVKGG
ncbi:NAD(P)-dependent oxidoreductase [Paenochrobactrum glaciei]|uniref:NAD(P)-dependent oxidoreductase n=1 Tax=Paenochrobactrum glaciei TaxID=486407 RepID=A0ABN1GFM1_9HYPH